MQKLWREGTNWSTMFEYYWKSMESWVGTTILVFVSATMRLPYFDSCIRHKAGNTLDEPRLYHSF